MTTPGRTAGRAAESGMTLAETLVVLAVIAIAAGAAVTGLLPRPAASAATEAARLADLLTLAADEALARQQELELAWTDDGYGFRAWSGASGGWQAPASGPLAADRVLPDGLVLAAAPGDRSIRIAPDGLSAAAVIEITGDGSRRRVVFDGLAAVVAEDAR
jgi:type II secretion system protein H